VLPKMPPFPTFLYLFAYLPFFLALVFYYYGLRDWAYSLGKYAVAFGIGVMVGGGGLGTGI